MKQVCIIGAGASGLTAAKTLKQAGISFDCFEKGSKIGGVWRYNNDNGLSSAYRSLHINTNKKVMAFSDFPMPKDYPMFPHHSQIIEYFENYAQHFDVLPSIQFNSTVVEVNQNDDGTYKVVLDNRQSFDYQFVIVANGHHWNPRYPELKGQFNGEIIHSHDYKEPNILQNKDVLVIGIGNSAVDIACEAARLHTGKVTISTRSRAYITPNWILGIPFDNLANRFTAKLPLSLQRILLKMSLWLARGNQEDYGVPVPDRPILSEHPTVSQELLSIAGRGLISFKPNVKYLNENTVTFEDGSQQDFDMIICATGYKITFPFLKHYPDFDVENQNDIRLYKKILHPDYPHLFFVGLIQPLGAIMPLSEAQAKWITQVIQKKIKLPSTQEMFVDIKKDITTLQKRYLASPRHTIQVDFYQYKSSIESELK